MLTQKKIASMRTCLVKDQAANQERVSKILQPLKKVSATSKRIQKQAGQVWDQLKDKKLDINQKNTYDVADILYAAAADLITIVEMTSDCFPLTIQSFSSDLEKAKNYLERSKTLYVSKDIANDTIQHKEVDEALDRLASLKQKSPVTLSLQSVPSDATTQAEKPKETNVKDANPPKIKIVGKRKRKSDIPIKVFSGSQESLLGADSTSLSSSTSSINQMINPTGPSSPTSTTSTPKESQKRTKLSVTIPVELGDQKATTVKYDPSMHIISPPSLRYSAENSEQPPAVKAELSSKLLHTFKDDRKFFRYSNGIFGVFNPAQGEWHFPEGEDLAALQAEQKKELASKKTT